MPAPTVVVLKPHDVVLAQVAAGLHLDDLQRHLAGILQPVGRTLRDVRGLVLGQNILCVVDCDTGCAFDDDPVIRTVVVLL